MEKVGRPLTLYRQKDDPMSPEEEICDPLSAGAWILPRSHFAIDRVGGEAPLKR